MLGRCAGTCDVARGADGRRVALDEVARTDGFEDVARFGGDEGRVVGREIGGIVLPRVGSAVDMRTGGAGISVAS